MSIILAGGAGTRLFPLTLNRCKPTIPFGGRFRLIDVPISHSLTAGIRDIAVVSQYFSADLNRYIMHSYQQEEFETGQFYLLSPKGEDMSVWYAGTADAIRKNRSQFLNTPAEYFLILSSDQLYHFDFRKMIDFAKQRQADLVIAAHRVAEDRAQRMGLLQLDDQHRVVNFYEKPTDPENLDRFRLPHPHRNQYLGSLGIYIFKKEALFSILQHEGDDFGQHIIPLQIERGSTYSWIFDGYWEDVGTISSYYQANIALTQATNCLDLYNSDLPLYSAPLCLPSPHITTTKIHYSIVSQGSKIHAEELHNSVVGPMTYIGRGSHIRNSIILGNHQSSRLGKNCLLDKVIIDENVKIGDNVHLINNKSLNHYDGNGFVVRDGIIVVMNGASLSDGFRF
jgi:glucose-1-phosphate adenylyltransferase